MHWRLIEHRADQSQACAQNHVASAQHHARWLPAPFTVEYIAQLDAAIERAPRKSGTTATRAILGVVAIAGAVTVPDLSVDAMGASHYDLATLEAVEGMGLAQPSVGRDTTLNSATVYVPASLGRKLDAAQFTFSTQARIEDQGGLLPLGFLEQGSEKFDLAFAEVPLPFASSVEFPLRRENPVPEPLPVSDALRARLIEIPQITNLSLFEPSRAAPQPERPQALAEVPVTSVGLGRAEQAVIAAFAGELDVSNAVREAIPGTPPVPQSSPQSLPQSSPQGAAAQVAVTVPSALAQAEPGSSLPIEVVLESKTQLDARINGVLTGSVDFQQLNGTIAIRLGSVVDILHDRFDASELDRIVGAGALDTFVTLATLQSAGIPIDYDPVYDEVKFGIDYEDAPNAAKVQIEQIGAPTLGNDRTLIDQIPR